VANRTNARANQDLAELRGRLAAAEQTLEAIRSGEVDALVVPGPGGDRLFTRAGAEHAYRVFVEVMNEGAATVSADGTILYCNRYFAEMIHHPLDGIIGTSIFNHIPQQDRKSFEALVLSSLQSSVKSELNLLTSSGVTIPVYVSLRSFEEFGSSALCMVVTDLSEQKRNEELLAAGKLANLLMEQATEIVVVCGINGQVLQASRALEQICGKNPLFQNFDHVLPLRIEAASSAGNPSWFSVQNLFTGLTFRGLEVTYQPPNSERMHFLMSASAITSEGSAIGCVINLFDIEERKRAEESLRRSEKLAATGRLAATIAHEINNPLEAVTNLLFLIENSARSDATTLKYAQLAQQELARVANITRQTLAFYRESRQPQTIRLKEIIESIISLYETKLNLKNLSLDTQLRSEGHILGFHNQLGQVISNLFLNAIEACPSGGKLTVRLSEGREWGNSHKRGVRLVIADNGSGIRSEDRARLFEPFFTTKGERGTGLGLWVSQGIITRHRGFLRLRSSVRPGNSGTVFSIFFPSAEQTEANPKIAVRSDDRFLGRN